MQVAWSNGKNKAPTVCEIQWDRSRKMFKVNSKTGALLMYSSMEKLKAGVEDQGRGKVLDGFHVTH